MEHIIEARLMAELWDGMALTEAERTHLHLCEVCQKHRVSLQALRDELAVAYQSQMSVEAESRLFAMLDEARKPVAQEGFLQRLRASWSGWVNALSLWDSRQQTAMVGVRSGNRSSYRMLFGADETEVELMVEPNNGLLRIVGEVMVGEATNQRGLALIELMAYADAKSAIEAESDPKGHFTLDHVPPGTYVLTITPRYSKMVVIEPLELT